jgi:biliverdin reductase
MSLYRYVRQPLRIGIVGTGFAAKVRAQAIIDDSRTQLVAVASGSGIPERAQEFATTFNCQAMPSWQELVAMSEVDLVLICSANDTHGPIAKAAIEGLRHVIVEYPLSLDPQEAEAIIFSAANRQIFLHVEHIELLGSLHQAMREWLDKIGQPQYARYSTLTVQNPVPRKWSYQRQQFGFPLAAALSRIHRFTDLFGNVDRVTCQERYWGLDEENYYHTSLCTAQLHFANGLLAEVAYGKGANIWAGSRRFEVQGDQGAMIFDGDVGTLIVGKEQTTIELGSRKGMFAQDLNLALEHFFLDAPDYIKPSDSLYSLRVANACRVAAEKQAMVLLPPDLR